MSIVGEAFSAWRECRAEYDDTLYAQYEAAEEATRGAILNARGREKGIDPFSLFIGNETRAMAYASEELIEHWASHRAPLHTRDRKPACDCRRKGTS